MKVSKFANQIDGTDYARPNLFEVVIQGTDAQAYVKATSVPAATVGVVEVPYQNRKIKVPGDRTFEDWTITVINDSGFTFRKQLLEWQKDLQQFDSFTGAHSGPASSHRTLTVIGFDRDGETKISTSEISGWPSEIGSIDLSWESNDAVQEYTVTFSVTWASES